MEQLYSAEFTLTDSQCDRYDRMKPSAILHLVQEVSGRHCRVLGVDWENLAKKDLFWAVIRHSVQIKRLPRKGQRIRVETWPMPTSRVAYPRSMVAYDTGGNVLLQSLCLWVLMDRNSRSMVLPGKSGVSVEGILRGSELPVPSSLPPAALPECCSRKVCFTDLDINGHMNNCRYLDWACDLLPSEFHRQHALRALTLGYLSEAREGEILQLQHEINEKGLLQLEIHRPEANTQKRIFCAAMQFENNVL